MFPFTQIQAVLPEREDHGSCELLQALSQEARDGGPPCLEVMHRCLPGFPTLDSLFPFDRQVLTLMMLTFCPG